MANRFTDTEKWKDEWFLALEPCLKMLWIYILDNCDHAGIWKVNFKLASYSIGTILDKQSAQNALTGKVSFLNDDKWHVSKFITYQYRGFLNPTNNAHKGVLKLLDYHGIETRPYLVNTIRHEPLVSKSSESLGSKEQEQEQDKDKDSSSFLNSSLKEESVKNSIRLDQLIQLFNETLAGKVGRIGYCHGLGANQTRDFLTTTSFAQFQEKEAWIKIFESVRDSEFLNGTKEDFVATLNWLVTHDNALKVLNGQYPATSGEQKGHPGSFKKKTNGVVPTPENPTGNPYTAERLAKGIA